MGLISEYVEIKLGGRNIKYYENLGYEIPRRKDKWGKVLVPKGAKITVKVKDLPKGSHTKVKIRCDNPDCNKEYEVVYRDYLKYNHNGKTYCNACGKKILNSRENNTRWNPNKTDEERENGRDGLEKTEFVKKVMARDNYTCQCCNKPLNHDGVVHHLNGWDNFKEQRYDVQNGITLCENCHKNFHSKYGYGNNTKEQFEEWYGEAVELVKYEGKLTTARQIYCIEEDKVYNGALEIEKLWNITNSNIYAVCNHKRNYKKGIIKGKHLLWLDEAIKKGYITK